MKEIFEYLDYRDFLREFYETNKAKNYNFSYRFLSQKTGVNPGYLVTVLQGKQHLASKHIAPFQKVCRFNESEAEYFEALFYFNKAKSQTEIDTCFTKLESLRAVRTTKVQESQYEFYTKWYYSAIRGLLGIQKFNGNFEELALSLTPTITVEEAKAAVNLLLDLKFLEKTEDDEIVLCDTTITTGSYVPTEAIHTFQKDCMDLAKNALVSVPKHRRDISTITLAIDSSQIKEVQEKAKEFRNSILKLAEKSNDPNCVYQLNLQFFPFAEGKD